MQAGDISRLHPFGPERKEEKFRTLDGEDGFCSRISFGGRAAILTTETVTKKHEYR
jgi:hypothetical protein